MKTQNKFFKFLPSFFTVCEFFTKVFLVCIKISNLLLPVPYCIPCTFGT